ncbi:MULTISPECIES: hypothetical protein [unclassified Streptomyces]|uniref:hypothetical protein n=1 Tax=unclassified Streptomyces TaxID=2593676 RepID=UPI00340643B9
MGTDDAANADQYLGGGVKVLFVALGDLFNCHGRHGLSVTVGDAAIVDRHALLGQVIPLMSHVWVI